MWFSSRLFGRGSRSRQARCSPARRRPASPRLAVEALEDRAVPAFLAPALYPGGTNELLVGDFNNDAVPDLVKYNGLLLGNGDGTFRSASATGTGIPLAVSDFNADGNLDLMAQGGAGYAVHLGNGDGTFQSARPIAAPTVNGKTQALDGGAAAGDLNNDGKDDLVVTGRVNKPSKGNRGNPRSDCEFCGFPDFNTYLNVLLSNGDGSFTAASTTRLGDNISGIPLRLGDFNRDANLDVLTSFDQSTSTANATGAILLTGRGNGSLGSPTVVAKVESFFGGSGQLAVGDFNADGRLDFALQQFVFLGQPGGKFQSAGSFAPPGGFLTVADVNRDGRLDFVWDNYPQGRVKVALGNGDGTFPAPLEFPTGTTGETRDLVVGDFNRDGYADVALVSDSGATILVLLNDGNW